MTVSIRLPIKSANAMSKLRRASAISDTARSMSRPFPAWIASLMRRFPSSISSPIRFADTRSGFTSFTSFGSSRYRSFRSPDGIRRSASRRVRRSWSIRFWSGVRGDQRLADRAQELLPEFLRRLGRDRRLRLGEDVARFGCLAGHVLQRLEDFPVVFLPFHDRRQDLVDAPTVLDRHLRGIEGAADVEEGQVRLARRTHACVRVDRRITDGTDFRFLRWRKPTPRIRRRVSILKLRTKTFRTQFRE